MTSQPDKLFRDKLDNFQRPAPSGAWNKIESNLKPSRTILGLKIAAGIAIMSAAAILIWPAQKSEIVAQVSDSNPVVKKKDRVQQPVSPVEKEEPIKKQTKDSNEIMPPVKNTVAITQIEEEGQKNIQPIQDSIILPGIPESTEHIAEVTLPDETSSHSKTIVYTADEVNTKFLKKKLPAEATPGNPEASGLQRLIGLAYAAKNSEAPLGSLRQKKDDILALDFSKKKVRTN